MKHWFAGAVVLTIISGTALAQSAPTNDPGGLTARDVTGKRLLDVNGAMIGRIESAAGQTAMVRTSNGKRIMVDMTTLSLGDGPHTIIEAGDSDAEKLNIQVESGK